MTENELQTIVTAVLSAIRTNSRTISELTPVTDVSTDECVELSGGKKILLSTLISSVADLVDISPNVIKGWVVITSTDELPEEPTAAEREQGYLLGTTLYVYIGEGGNAQGGTYQSVELQGPQGNPGVDLGEVELINDLTTGGVESALTAEMGKTLKGLIDDIDTLIEPFETEVFTRLTPDGIPTYQGEEIVGGYVNVNNSMIARGHNNVKAVYYAVTAGEELSIKFASGNTAAKNGTQQFNAYGLGWFSSVSAPVLVNVATALLQISGVDVRLSECAGETLRVTVPSGVNWLVATEWIPVTDSVVVSRISNVLDVATKTEVDALDERVDALEEDVENFDSVTGVVELSAIDADMGPSYAIYMPAPYYSNTCKFHNNGSGGTWGSGWEVSAGERYRVKFEKAEISGAHPTWVNFTAVAFFASEPNTNLMDGYAALKTAGDASSYIKFGDFESAAASFDVEVPVGYTWMVVSNASGKAYTVHKLELSAIDLLAREAIEHEIEWSVPSTLYAIVGEEKRVYIDCILKDFGYYVVTLHGSTSNTITVTDYSDQKRADPNPSNPNDYYKKLVACINGGYLYFRAITAGETSITLDVYDIHGNYVGNKVLRFVAIEKELPSRAMNVCVVGDSITEIFNMAAFIENKFIELFPDDEHLPKFVGSKSGSYYAPSSVSNKVRYEGWWGKYYRWLDGELIDPNTPSPMVKNGVVDIANYRTLAGYYNHGTDSVVMLPSDQRIDIVSFAMGSNNTLSADDRNKELNALKTLIAAFKADNANTIFVVQLNTLLGKGGGVDMWMNKLLTRYEWRKLLLNDAVLAADQNIIIGDLGCCYDRFYAYRTNSVAAAPQYPDEMVERIKMNTGDEGDRIGNYAALDIQHPSEAGEQQLGESIVPVLLAAMQKGDN